MAQVTLPYTLTAGTPENVNNLMSNLTALRDGVNTIDTAQLAASSVTAAKLATDAVETAKIKDGAVTAAKLASGAVAAGLDYIGSVTGASNNSGGISIDSVFSSTYDNYRLIWSGYGDNSLRLRFRTGGSDQTASNYRYWQWYGQYSDGSSGRLGYGSAASYCEFWVNGGSGTERQNHICLDIASPYLTDYTTFSGQYTSAAAYAGNLWGTYNNSSTSFDGIKVYTASSPGKVVGTLRVYGYKNA